MLNTKIRSHLTQLARVAAVSFVLALGFTQTAFAYQAVTPLVPVTMTAGTNPGNLAMFQYLPTFAPGKNLNRPLVVVLHGCTQDAVGFAHDSGWQEMAEMKGLYLVVAQTNTTNNSNKCFRWFDPTQNVRGAGEAASIAAMVAQFQASHTGLVDPNNIYVAGFSAGGAMAAVMMATYPNVFSGGAVNSGIPYGCGATNWATALMCMSTGPILPKTAAQWGAAAVAGYPSQLGAHKQKVAIFHGDYRDITVLPARLTELQQQWTAYDGLSQLPTTVTPVKSFPAAQYSTPAVIGGGGKVQTVSVSGLNGMGHGVAVDPGPATLANGVDQCGFAGTYSFSKGLCAAYYSCAVWGF